MCARTNKLPPMVVKTDSNPCGKLEKSLNEGKWWPPSHVEHPNQTPQNKRAIPKIARITRVISWCFLHPMKKEKVVKGTTAISIQRWNSLFTQKVEAIMGKRTISNGVSKQWTAQIKAIPTPKRSSHKKLLQETVDWVDFTIEYNSQHSSFCKMIAYLK